MTESDWLGDADPWQMLVHLRIGPRVQQSKAGRRRLRLFAVACCRRLWPILPEGPLRRAVEVNDRYAEGLAERDEVETARSAALTGMRSAWAALRAAAVAAPLEEQPLRNAVSSATWRAGQAVFQALRSEAYRAAREAALGAAMAAAQFATGPLYHSVWRSAVEAQKTAQRQLLRDLFGNPFRRPVLDPLWRRSNDGAAVRLAGAVHEEQAFERLPILADALEDAGCDDAGLLGHCRGPGPHVRGCWAVDLILGKS
jgi:hypothetical protein